MAIRYNMAVGLNKGYKVTENKKKPRPSRRKGVSNHLSGCMLSAIDWGWESLVWAIRVTCKTDYQSFNH